MNFSVVYQNTVDAQKRRNGLPHSGAVAGGLSYFRLDSFGHCYRDARVTVLSASWDAALIPDAELA
jgi:hypothetical protein